MPKFATTGQYQGINLSGWSVSRKPGLSPDIGWVEMPIENLGQINLEPQFRPWLIVVKGGKAQGVEPPGPMHLGAALKQLGAGVTNPDGITKGGKAAGALNRGGDLVFSTEVVGGQGPTSGAEANAQANANDDRNVVLSPMYITPSGIREIETDLASATLHNEGTIRIGVTDIRYWWDKYGTPVVGDYNITNAYGTFDEQFLIGKKPSTLGDFINYLCYCLPGSPKVLRNSACFEEGIAHPQNLRMRFELPSVWLYKLLEAYGMELHLTRGSNVYIGRRGGEHAPQFFTRNAGGNDTELGIKPEEEKKTVYAVDVPEGVFVSGNYRQRRATVVCEPCFTDEDGVIRRFRDLPILWNGYTVDQARYQATLSHEKAYQNVPHSDGKQYHARVEIAKRDFFRMYAPSNMFEPDIGFSGAYKLWDQSQKLHPFMPMKAPVYFKDELALLPGVKLALAKDIPDSDNLVEMPAPVVRASIVRKDFSDDLSDFQQRTGAALKSLEGAAAAIIEKERAASVELAELDEGRPMWKAIEQGGPIVRELNKYGLITVDSVAALKEFGNNLIPGGIAKISRQLQQDADWNAVRKTLAERSAENAKGWKKELEDLNRKISKLRENFHTAFKAVERFKYARMWVNVPWGVVDGASVDRHTGVVRFSDFAAVMDIPAVRDIENAVFVGDGSVEVTYQYEVRRNRPTDFVFWAFMAPEPGGKIALSEIDEPTGLKCHPIRDETLVLYEREDGQPMNLGPITEKACRIAGNVLDQDRQRDGYEYKYLGMWKIATDDAQNEVVWTFDGDNAYTRIFANHPDGSASGWDSLSQKRAKESLIYLYGDQVGGSAPTKGKRR